MNDVRIFDLKFDEQETELFLNDCRKILETGYLTNHHFVEKFEKEFANISRNKFNIAVNNGTSALQAIFLAHDIRGKEVLLPTNTFIGDWLAIKQAGGFPVLVDMEPHFLGMDGEKAQEKLTKNTCAILAVHIGGIVSPDIIQLQKICAEKNLALFEDCAHSLGSDWKGIPAGTFGLASAYSFHLTKVLTTGEGGMVVSNQENFSKKVQSVRQFGKTEANPHEFSSFGWNMKLTEFQAALGLLELKRTEKRIKKRNALANLYQERLKGSSWEVFTPHQESKCSYYKTIIMSPIRRDILTQKLNDKGISLTNGVYFTPLHKQEVVINNSANLDKYPKADFFSQNHFCPPCYPELDLDSVNRICDELLKLTK